MTRKLSFLSTVGAAALIVGVAASPAKAFDVVNWEWNLTVNEVVNKRININSTLVPDGMLLLENVQVHVGDVTATSVVSGIDNNAAGGNDNNGATQTVDLGMFGVDFNFGSGGQADLGSATYVTTDAHPQLDPELTSGSVTGGVNGGGNVNINVALGTIEVEWDMDNGALDAVDLPEVISVATAVGNNSSITSDVMVQIHEGQFLFNTVEGLGGNDSPIGDLQGAAGEAILALFSNHGDVNTHHLLGAAVMVGAIGGLIDKSEVTAVSRVTDILNATVDSAATAVGNNKSITLEARSPNNSVLLGDVTQVSVADVRATSRVQNVDLNNYANLGDLGRPIVSSVATAVGNNLSVNLSTLSPATTQ
ncbi:MAG: hypothetical protein ACK4QW_15450 [Alphaproteobacteria bacterium]